MHKKGIQQRKWRTFLRKLSFFALLCLISFVICLGIWLPALWQKRPLLTPLGTIAASAINDSQSQIMVGKVEALCGKYHVAFDSVSVASDSSILVNVKDNGQAILSSKKDLENQVASLQLTISNLTIEGKRFDTLDFRFERPVITLH